MTEPTIETKVFENVVYKGEPGSLTLSEKFFHYQANNVEAQVKCSWNKVEKRQLSPPGAEQALIKLVLLSGRTAVFEVADTKTLVQIVRDVKVRMDHAAKTAQATPKLATDGLRQPVSKLPAGGPGKTVPRLPDGGPRQPPKKAGDHKEEEKTTESSGSSDGRGGSGTRPPIVLEDPEGYPSRLNKQDDDDDEDEKKTPCYCLYDLYCWIILAGVVVVVLILAFVLIYLLVLQEDDNTGSNNARGRPRTFCNDTLPDCPPDDGLEDRYGIRAVEYVWTKDWVRLEYYISDYILDSSVNYTLYDGEDCRGTDLPVEAGNKWLETELVDGAPIDGGANLYNEGRGTRQFDIVVSPLWNSTLETAPFYQGLLDTEKRGFMRVCLGFRINYNQNAAYSGVKEVNYIENALQMTVDPEGGGILDVQIRTVTWPTYKV